MGRSPALRQYIVELLINLPTIHDNYGQQAFLHSAGLDETLVNLLTTGLPPKQFVELLVSTCIKYGKLHDERYALEAVLQTAKDYIGKEKQEWCDSILQELHQKVWGNELSSHQQCQQNSEIARPYKFLDYYDISDEDKFFGREHEIIEVITRIKDSRFLVLYGVSGVGKTSLVLAGIIPYLTRNNSWCIHTRCEEDPEYSIKAKVHKTWPIEYPSLQDNLSAPLPQFLACAADYLKKPIVIFLDQFEEFFLRLPSSDREAFKEVLGSWNTYEPCPFKLVLGIREDYLGKLDELHPFIPNPLALTYRLTNLKEQNAMLAIKNPAERAGLVYEEGMIERLLEELLTQSKTEYGIFPPHLQIVCSTLAESTYRASQVITWMDVQKYGGIAGLLDRYIEQALSTLKKEQRELAWNILKRATTSARTKFALKADELDKSEDDQELLKKLVDRRLMRKITTENGEEAYELAHDKLAETLNQKMSGDEKLARDLLDMVRLEFVNWEKHQIPMDREKILLLKENKGNPYLQLTDEWKEFIRKSEKAQTSTLRKQRMQWIVLSIIGIGVLGLVYYYYPRWFTPKPNIQRVRVNAGIFVMGSNIDSPYVKPMHTIHIDSFDISKYEITNKQYAAFVQAMRWNPPDSEYFGKQEYAQYPVVGIDWKDAIAFCNWVGGRLPTEAEWEKAATWNAATNHKQIWPWGDRWDVNRAILMEGDLKKIAPVYILPEGQSPYGVMHMVGNVAEWTSSIDLSYPYDVSDGREKLDDIAPRIVRGNSWVELQVVALPTNRTGFEPTSRDRMLGFRVAWSVNENGHAR